SYISQYLGGINPEVLLQPEENVSVVNSHFIDKQASVLELKQYMSPSDYSVFHMQYIKDLIANKYKPNSKTSTMTLGELFHRGWQELKNKQFELEEKLERTGALTTIERAKLKGYYKMENEYSDKVRQFVPVSQPLSIPSAEQILNIEDPLLNAALSLDVYRDPNRPSLPNGWQVYMDCPPELQIDGYFGAAYYSSSYIERNAMNISVVIAHRGTANRAGITEDIQIYLFDTVPAQFKNSALPFIKQVIAKINQDFPYSNPNTNMQYGAELGFTGHSLGGALAELSTAYTASMSGLRYEHDYPNSPLSGLGSYCNSFESPGSGQLLTVLLNDKMINCRGIAALKNILETYVADIDAINTALEHVGYEIQIIDVGYDWLPDVTGKLPMAPDLVYYFRQYSIEDQHRMQKMYNAIKNGGIGPSRAAINWPVGADAGLAAYMQYSPAINPNHFIWWEGYMERLWQQYPDLQSEYVGSEGNPDYSAFKESYISQYLNGINLTVVEQNAIVPKADKQSSIVDVRQHLLPSSFIGHLQDSASYLTPTERTQVNQLIKDEQSEISYCKKHH
ncbi:MAG: lipase family protein, partial [Gammaproteobacteria bacterium]